MRSFWEAVLITGFVLLIFGMMLGIGHALREDNYSIEKGDCFDRYGNKINGVTCDQRVYEGSEFVRFTPVIIIVIAGIFIIVAMANLMYNMGGKGK